jgi:hypothetical protein
MERKARPFRCGPFCWIESQAVPRTREQSLYTSHCFSLRTKTTPYHIRADKARLNAWPGVAWTSLPYVRFATYSFKPRLMTISLRYYQSYPKPLICTGVERISSLSSPHRPGRLSFVVVHCSIGRYTDLSPSLRAHSVATGVKRRVGLALKSVQGTLILQSKGLVSPYLCRAAAHNHQHERRRSLYREKRKGCKFWAFFLVGETCKP